MGYVRSPFIVQVSRRSSAMSIMRSTDDWQVYYGPANVESN